MTDEGIQLKIPTTEAPFGATTVPTRTVPHDPSQTPDMEDRVIREPNTPTGKIVAFRVVLHVDNNPCQSEINPIKVTGDAPGTWETVGACGFIRYPPQKTPASPPAQASISFRASHANNFARFLFTIVKGSAGYVNTVCAPSDPGAIWTSLPLVNSTPVNGFIRDSTSTYTKQTPVTGLVGACPDGTAAFGENLYVYALATDGWSRLYYLDSYATPKAFALQPKPKS